MNKPYLFPFAVILFFFACLVIYGKVVGGLPIASTTVTTMKSDMFASSGEGKVSVKPDMAVVSVGISSTGRTVQQTQEQVNSVIAKITQAVKQLGVDEKDIQTSNYSVYPSYSYDKPAQSITGYQASSNLTIKVKAIDKVNSVIDAATANGANQVSGVTFDIADKTKAENEAREMAVAEAKRKAADAARIAGFRLGRVINYSETPTSTMNPMPYEARALDASGGATPTQVSPGSNDVMMTVYLSYEIL